MDTKEIMVNDEVLETVEEVATTDSKWMTIAPIVGLSILGGMAIYKYVIKPTMAKIRAKKELDSEFKTIEFKNIEFISEPEIEIETAEEPE